MLLVEDLNSLRINKYVAYIGDRGSGVELICAAHQIERIGGVNMGFQ